MTALRATPPEVAARADAYDCFVSYARDPDQELAKAVRRGLAGLAKPWYRRRALRVFQDTASLSASPELEASIVAALERSRFFILLASPAAAQRPWVDREVAWWREHRDPHSVLIADCGAQLNWDDQLGDFSAGARVPPSLRGWFPAEPTWTDLSWAQADQDLGLRNSRFSDHVADLAAPVRGMSKDALVGEDIRQHRRSLRLAWGAAATLLALAAAATVAALIAVHQRHQAIVQRDRAQARALAALAEATRASDPLTSLRDATQSLALVSTAEGVRALRGTLAVPLRRVLNSNERVDRLAFTPDGSRLAQAGRGGVSLWNLRTGKLAPASPRGPTFVAGFSFDASGNTLATVGQAGSVNVLEVADLAGGSSPRTIRVGNLLDGAISPDGATAALATQDGRLVLRELRGGRTTLLDRRAGAFGLQFSPDGRRLLATGDQGLSVWRADPAGGRVDIPAGSLLTARFTRAGTVVAVGANGTVTTWSPAGTRLGRTRIATGPDPVAAVSPDGRLVAVGSGSSVDVWDLATGARRVIGSHPGGGITAVAFGPGAMSLASAAEGDAVIRIWDLQTAPARATAGRDFYASILTASGPLIAAAEDSGAEVAVWPIDGGTRRVFRAGGGSILAAGFMPDGRGILAVSDDGAARLIDARTGTRRLLRGGLGPADVAALSPDRRRVAVAVDGGALRVWTLAGGPPVTLARRTHGLYQLSFGAGGRVAATSGARHVDVWGPNGGPPARLAAPQGIDLVAFSPSGHALAGGGGVAGAGVYVWRGTQPGARPALVGRHRHFVTALAWVPDGSGVASAGDTGPVYLWPLDGGSGITLASGTAQSTGALAIDPTGRTVAFSDGTLRVLSCEACGTQARLVAEARRLLSRGGLP